MLEQLLIKAIGEPSYLAEFLKNLLTEKLLVITNYDERQEEENKLATDQQIGIFKFGDGSVPVFTSRERVFDKSGFSKDVKLLSGKGEYLFKLLSGSAISINPYSEYRKELSAEQISRLLDGTYFTGSLINAAIESGAAVMLDQPQIYPKEIIKSLITLFSAKPDVIAAYLGWIYDPAANEPAHYIFAIETTGEMTNLSSEAIYVAKYYLPAGEIVDFVQIDRTNSISDYFIKNTKPFYTKSQLA